MKKIFLKAYENKTRIQNLNALIIISAATIFVTAPHFSQSDIIGVNRKGRFLRKLFLI